MAHVFTSPSPPTLAVAGQDDVFPIRRVFCVGRNYEAHAREMGNDPDREPPFFFTKPADAVVQTPFNMPYPVQTSDLHHEIELVVGIGKGGADIAPDDVPKHVWGATVGIDFTRRDLQQIAKDTRRPWDMSKGFDNSAPMAPIVPMQNVASLTAGRIWLKVNGALRQESDISQMIWSVNDHVAYLSQYVTLAPGDIIMTGTPAGVAAVGKGDVLEGGVDGIATLRVEIS